MGWSPFFVDCKSYTMVSGVAAPQDFLKVLLQCEFRIESNTQKFHLRIDFEPIDIQFLIFGRVLIFWREGDLENMMTLLFSGFSFILHLAHHFANFRRSLPQKFCCKLYIFTGSS